MLGEPLVDFGSLVYRSADKLFHEAVARWFLFVLFRIERIVKSRQRLIHGELANIALVQNLNCTVTRSAPGCHAYSCPSGLWRSLRSRFTISMAVIAASNPLLPLLAPARSMA